MKRWGVESGALARPHAELPVGRPCLPPPPLPGQSLWSLRRGAGAPTGRVGPAPSQKGAELGGCCALGPGGKPGTGSGSHALAEQGRGWLLSFPSSGPPVRERQCQQRWGGDGSKRGPTSRPCLDHAGKQEVGRLHTAGEGPLERHCWGLRQGASERAQRPPTPRAHRWGVA